MSNFTNNKTLNESLEKCLKYFSNDSKKTNASVSLSSVLSSQVQDNYIHYFPYSVFWKITSKCNLRCKHCFYYKNQSVFDNSNDFSTEEILKLADYLIDELNIINFIITGGEPFLQKDILQILKYLKSKNVSILIKTNGTLITKSVAKELKNILNPKNDSTQISIDGVTEHTYDKIRGKGNFQKCLTGINNLINNNINTSISFTATSLNVEEIPELYSFCKKFKIRNIMINRFKICSKDQEYLVPLPEKLFIKTANLIDLLEQDKNIYCAFGVLKVYDFLNFNVSEDLLDKYLPLENISHNLMCHKHDKITISGNGDIYLCTETETEELSLGNLKEKSFIDIWENRFNNVFFQDRHLEKSVCKECKYVNYCYAGCPAKAYFKYGDIHAPDSECLYGQKLFEQNKKRR